MKEYSQARYIDRKRTRREERRWTARQNRRNDTLIKHGHYSAHWEEFAAYFTRQNKKQKRNR